MPVKTEETINLIHYLSRNPTTESLLPDDIWAKFGVDYNVFDEALKKKTEALKKKEAAAQAESAKAKPEVIPEVKPEPIKLVPFKEDLFQGADFDLKGKLRNHDCMWAGHCFSDEHPTDEHPAFRLLPLDGLPFLRPYVKQESAQQSLLKPAVRVANAALPQTPPMSDDEEMRLQVGGTSVLRLLHDAIEDCDLDEDSDLCDYFEDKEEEEVEVVDEGLREEEEEDVEEEEEEERAGSSSSLMRSCQFAAESDHSYHKGQAASPAEMLGIDTPSDSEEEIDVVSVVDKAHSSTSYNPTYPATSSRSTFLPSNPAQHQIHHRRIVKAISRKNKPASSIKTILPVRKPEAAPSAGGKRKAGVKRAKQYRVAPPSKRRNCHSSDSEPEPSEKRNLHNNMERQRRVDLRNAFEDLRVLVPEVSKKERAAKVVILREAAQYCDLLTNNADNHVKQCEDLKRQQEWLRHRVSQLRRNLAAKR